MVRKARATKISRPALWIHLGPIALFAALAIAVAYPLWLGPATRVQDDGDPLLNAWILRWVQGGLLGRPGGFFEANVFWPFRSSLCYGELMLTQSILALPGRLLTDNPVAIHTFSLIEGYFLSAVGAYLLGLYYFSSILPAAIAGLAYGFAGFRISQSLHLQLVHGEFLPLMVLAFERALSEGRRRWSLALGAAALGQWLASWYWAVFSFWCMAPYMAARLWMERKRLDWRRTGLVFIPLIAAAVLTAPLAWPYYRMLRSGQLVSREASNPAEAETYRARPADFLVPPGRSLLYDSFGAGHQADRNNERALFPGVVVAAGFIAALAFCFNKRGGMTQTQGRPEFPLLLWSGITVWLLLLTFGYDLQIKSSRTPLPLALLRGFPLTGEMRAPSRWMLPAALGLALLTAESWRRLSAWRWRGARPAAWACLGLLAAECLTRPLPYVTVPAQAPAGLEFLNRQPYPSPVVMFPLDYGRTMHEAAWLRQPMANGYNGYFPPNHFPLLYKIAMSENYGLFKAIGIRFVAFNNEEVKKRTPEWNPEQALAQFQGAPGVQASLQGNYLVLDLGPAETDRARIESNYADLVSKLLM